LLHGFACNTVDPQPLKSFNGVCRVSLGRRTHGIIQAEIIMVSRLLSSPIRGVYALPLGWTEDSLGEGGSTEGAGPAIIVVSPYSPSHVLSGHALNRTRLPSSRSKAPPSLPSPWQCRDRSGEEFLGLVRLRSFNFRFQVRLDSVRIRGRGAGQYDDKARTIHLSCVGHTWHCRQGVVLALVCRCALRDTDLLYTYNMCVIYLHSMLYTFLFSENIDTDVLWASRAVPARWPSR
jgi:hypothetical protein